MLAHKWNVGLSAPIWNLGIPPNFHAVIIIIYYIEITSEGVKKKEEKTTLSKIHILYLFLFGKMVILRCGKSMRVLY